MGVNFLYVAAFSTVASFVGLQWWVFSLVDGIKADGLIDEGEIHSGNARRVLELVLGSNVTVALLVNFVLNVFALVVLCLKTLLFVQLYPSETRKVLECLFGYVVNKGTFLPLVVPPNTFQIVLWSSWLIILCSLKMFQSLARDRLERLNASPSATASKYFRVFSTLLLVLVADILWIRLCMTIYRSFTSNLFLLLFFEPLSIVFETLQAIMVHGFQFMEIWQRHSVDCDDDCLGSLTLFKSTSGSLSEWKGIVIRNCGFLLDMLTLSMALGHHLIIWWLHGMVFHLVDAVLFLNFRGLVGATVKRIRGYIKLRRALNSLNGALPDATHGELSAFNDECAICRGPMARAKKLSCNHLFHLACLRSCYMRGRLTFDKVNIAINEIATLADANSQLITAPKKKLTEDTWEKALELRDIAMAEAVRGKHFFLETNIKGPGLKLDNTGKAILTVLRHLGRIQETRIGHHRVITLMKPQ